MWYFILVAVNVLKASAIVWLCSRIRMVLWAAIKEPAGDTVVRCLEAKPPVQLHCLIWLFGASDTSVTVKPPRSKPTQIGLLQARSLRRYEHINFQLQITVGSFAEKYSLCVVEPQFYQVTSS